MNVPCERELGTNPVTVKKSNSCIGKDHPISSEILNNILNIFKAKYT